MPWIDLAQRLEQLHLNRGTASSENSESNQIHFVRECLDLLKAIQGALLDLTRDSTGKSSWNASLQRGTHPLHKDAAAERDHVGVRDLRLIHTLLQVVVSWGLYPHFLPGVGVPLSQRVKSGYINHELMTSQSQPDAKMQGSHYIQALFGLTAPLVDMVNQSFAVQAYTTVGSLLHARHLPDLFASLLQIAYGPEKDHPKERDTAARMFMWIFEK